MRPEWYIWRDERRSLTIELALAVVDRLGLEALNAYKCVPRRGLEIGGLLLGRRRLREGQTVIQIEDCLEVPSEHRSGPSYSLSSTDLQRLEQAFFRHPNSVGMYRTATQAETLEIHRDDPGLLQHHFISGGVLLLIHPASRQAAFCIPKEDGLEIAHEFPFRSAELAGEPTEGDSVPQPVAVSPAVEVVPPPETPDRVQPLAAPEPVRPVEVAPQTVAVEPRRTRRRSGQTQVWLVRAAAVLAGGVLGAFSWRLIEPRPSAPPTRSVPAATPSNVSPFPADHVRLRVERDGRTLRLEWDRNAPAIRNAQRGVLHIVDGDHQTDLNLSTTELETGVLSYSPDSSNVGFRLEVFGTGVKTDDSIVAAVPAGAGAPGRPLQQPVTSASAEDTAPARGWDKGKAAEKEKRDRDEEYEGAPRTRAEPAAPEAERSRPAPVPPTPKNEPARRELDAVNTPAPAPSSAKPPAPSRTPEPRVEVSAEPVPASRLSRVVSHIPLVRRFKKQQQTVVPPEPTHEAKPSIPETERHNVTAEVPIDVKVYLTNAGKVDYAELMDGHSQSRHPALADAALFAARRWNFRPAKIGDENVASEVILHFRFKPGEENVAASQGR